LINTVLESYPKVAKSPIKVIITDPNKEANYYEAIHSHPENPKLQLPTIEELRLIRKYKKPYMFSSEVYLSSEELELDSDKIKTFNMKQNREGKPIKKSEIANFILAYIEYK
jgi:hypothetical protein